jgi:hypothetical protein
MIYGATTPEFANQLVATEGGQIFIRFSDNATLDEVAVIAVALADNNFITIIVKQCPYILMYLLIE